MRRALLILLLATVPAAAAPNPQLLRSIEIRLERYDVDVDVTTLSTRQAAALHLELSDPENSYFDVRRKLISILNWKTEERR